MQRYEPGPSGTMMHVIGGDFVLHSEAVAAIQAAEAERDALAVRVRELEARIDCIADSMNSKFHVGDQVEKFTGDYQLPGEVRSVFVTRLGRVRLVVEHPAGFCHIYSEANLRALEDALEPSQ